MTKLTVISLNTFGGTFNFINRYLAISDQLNSSEADILLFQEVYSYLHLILLKKHLKNYPFVAYKGSIFMPKGGLVIFSRQPLTKVEFIEYSRKYVPYLGKSMVELFTGRGILTAIIKGKNIRLINTHLTAVLNADWSQKSKYYKELDSEITQFHSFMIKDNDEFVTIASGDFNIAKGTDLGSRLVGMDHLFDPFKDDLSPTRHPEYVQLGRKPNRVDYIFLGGKKSRCTIINSKMVFTEKVQIGTGNFNYVSDHIGLQVSAEIDS